MIEKEVTNDSMVELYHKQVKQISEEFRNTTGFKTVISNIESAIVERIRNGYNKTSIFIPKNTGLYEELTPVKVSIVVDEFKARGFDCQSNMYSNDVDFIIELKF